MTQFELFYFVIAPALVIGIALLAVAAHKYFLSKTRQSDAN